MLWVLLVFESEDDDGPADELREIIGPFETQQAAARHRDTMSADKFEVVALTPPGTPTT